MKSKLIYQQAGERTFALVFEIDDDPIAGLSEFARSQNLAASHFTGIGAFREATLAYFDWDRKEFVEIPIREQVEVLTLAGDIALEEGRPKVHAHVVVGKRDGSAHGGHLKAARVRPTLEVVLVESPAHLRRRMDPTTGLALIDLSAT
ncbi:MAG TPA: PPC domain-containing DNA-binding protein [Tepidisphaeraceae bacterium]|nr:PPC domain-containing DNA-binding protein [Tepidisphaeraceae bacterium]